MNITDIKESDIWVLAGQSNMQGMASLVGAPQPHPHVYCFSSAGQWEIAEGSLHRLWESFTPVHQNLMRESLPSEKAAWSDAELAAEDAKLHAAGVGGYGPGLSFGRAMYRRCHRPVGLIPCAHSGTTMEQWSPELKGTGAFYGAMLERIQQAGGLLKGVLWYQGEADATPERACLYEEHLHAWIEALRRDLNRPELPIIVVQIARRALGSSVSREAKDAWDLVRKVQYELPVKIPGTAVVGSVDLGFCDTVHLDTDAQNRMGERLALAAERLQSMPGMDVAPRLLGIERLPHLVPELGLLRMRFSGVSGSWRPQAHMAGFSICLPDGSINPDCWVIQAYLDPEEGSAILLLLNRPAPAGCLVVYGKGMDPYCNITDESDMALCAFGSTEILTTKPL